jgi:hypothetical protein
VTYTSFYPFLLRATLIGSLSWLLSLAACMSFELDRNPAATIKKLSLQNDTLTRQALPSDSTKIIPPKAIITIPKPLPIKPLSTPPISKPRRLIVDSLFLKNNIIIVGTTLRTKDDTLLIRISDGRILPIPLTLIIRLTRDTL